jgi:DNA repair protein NreA
VKQYESIKTPVVYETIGLDNRWLVFMFPGAWSYELIEAWYPNTTWNMESKDIAIYSSSELFNGRKGYAEIGGCYYAARLAVTERLEELKAQARVVILRETHPGYIMPVGVWNVREHVRAALRNPPTAFDSTRDALDYVAGKMTIPLSAWIRNSTVLRYVLHQRLLGAQ